MEGRVADTAFHALKTEWDSNAAIEFLLAAGPVLVQSAVDIVKCKFPATVEVHPLLALELRLRVFGARDLLREQQRSAQKGDCNNLSHVLNHSDCQRGAGFS